MKNLLLFITAQLLIASTYASVLPDFQWATDIGTTGLNELNATAIDNNGDVYATGNFGGSIDVQPGPGIHTLNSSGGTDMYLVKYNSAGTVLWAFNLSGVNTPSANENGYGLSTDNAGNVYVTGNFNNTVDFDPGAGTSTFAAMTYEAFVAKYDGSGNYLWAFKIAGGILNAGRDLQTDANGDVVVAGTFGGTTDFDPGAGTYSIVSSGNSDVFVAKYTAAGSFVWAFSIGGTGDDYVRNVDTDANGNIIITGNYQQTVDLDPGAGSNMASGGSDNNLFLASYDAAGNHRWGFGYGGAQSDIGFGVAVDNNGDVVLTGQVAGTVDVDPGAGVLNIGAMQSNYTALVLVKYSNSGQLVWGLAFGGTTMYGCSGRAVDTDQWGNIYITGVDGDEMDFDPGSGVFTLPSYVISKSFLACYSSTGAFEWAFGHTTAVAGNSFGNTVQIDQNNDALVFGGHFVGTYDFDPDSTATYNITSSGKSNGFIAYYTYEGIIKSVNEEETLHFDAWPNPSAGILNIAFDAGSNTENFIEVFDCRGAIVRRISTQERTLQIDLSNEAAGVYFVRCSCATFTSTRKFMLE